ncbi:hypothetical protein BMG523Draft_03733, partial [Frankia sp. BMG5.23]
MPALTPGATEPRMVPDAARPSAAGPDPGVRGDDDTATRVAGA